MRASALRFQLTLLNPPGRNVRPTFQLLRRPSDRLIRMTRRARIRNFECIRRRRHNKSKRVTPYVNVRDRLLNFGHMARDTIVARTPCPVMRMLLNRGSMRTIRRSGTVAFEADHICRLD